MNKILRMNNYKMNNFTFFIANHLVSSIFSNCFNLNVLILASTKDSRINELE